MESTSLIVVVAIGCVRLIAAIALEAEEDVVEIFGMMENHMKATSMRCAM